MGNDMNSKLVTAGVVFGGIAALALGYRWGVDKDVLLAGSGLLVALAGSLRSMLLPEVKP